MTVEAKMRVMTPMRVVGVGLALAIGALALVRARLEVRREAARLSAARAAVVSVDYGSAPQFELTERSGRTVTSADLRGKVWIADFIFTRCLGPCPEMTSKMRRLQDMLAGVPDVVLTTFTVDPQHDTPEVLREYAAAKGADPQRWLFLTGSIEALDAVQVKGFRIGMAGESIHHSTSFVLVDREGRIRGYYDSNESGVLEKLAADAAALAKGGGS